MRALLIITISLCYALCAVGQIISPEEKKCNLQGVRYYYGDHPLADTIQVKGVNGFRMDQGMVLSLPDSTGIEEWEHKNKRIIVLTKSHIDKEGKRCDEILDTINITLRRKNQEINNFGYCKDSAYPNSLVIAVIEELNKKGDKYRIIKAWHVDEKANKILSITISKIKEIECTTNTELRDVAE